MNASTTKPNFDVSTAKLEARSTLYALFAKALSHPSDEILDGFASGTFADTVAQLLKSAGVTNKTHPIAAKTGPNFSTSDIRTAYTSAFEAGLPKVSLREINYVREGEKILFEDLFRFYDHFGLDTSSGALREWPDHIAVELEFMHYLTWLEASTINNRQPLRLAQQDFLARHLGHWVEELGNRLEQKKIAAPYPEIAVHLVNFIGAEIR
jgi:putative dimethyl sulfoxide reductase chaperone